MRPPRERRWSSDGPDATFRIARDLLAECGPGAVLALHGELGAGKTSFVQGLARALGIDAAVCSPTFTLVNEYRGRDGARLVHIDLYRLAGPDDLDAIGWDDYLDSGDAMAVEWPERAGGELPPRAIFVDIRIGDAPDERRFHVTAPDAP